MKAAIRSGVVTSASAVGAAPGGDALAPLLRRYWGFDTLRPMQARAIGCGIEGRDSLVVMPTGGGKSLCFQAPPLVHGKLTVVVSPLIALMKDQVDALRLAGYAAASLNSHTTAGEAREAARGMDSGELRLLYVAPERLFSETFIERLRQVGVHSFAIDEAHCISAWGHDFRPEYRRLSTLRELFPSASVHAFTATATPRVREDIAAQLHLREPEVIVGRFDRANLTYRVVARGDITAQVEEAARRHPRDATIVYCLSRKETEQIAMALRERGVAARAYHAGLEQGERREVQDAFAQERLNVVVATVAFGMGIDRSNVRCVVHVGHPKSLEAYQQETGRAGRDGLPSECLLLYSGGDAMRLERLIEMSAEGSEVEVSPEWIRHQKQHVREMQQYCTSGKCRHAALSEYFGQVYEVPASAGEEESGLRGCGACDVCLGELEMMPEAKVVAQKIVSCVARLGLTVSPDGSPMEYGAKHIGEILRGRAVQAVKERGHDQLSTFGLLREMGQSEIASCITQLVAQKVLRRDTGGFPTVGLGERARALLKGEIDVTLVRSKGATKETRDALDPADAELFEALRELRRTLAQERQVPAFVILADTVLREIASRRPTTPASFRGIPGIGEAKTREFGPRFAGLVASFCKQRGLATDRGGGGAGTVTATSAPAPKAMSTRTSEMFRMFEEGMAIEEVMRRTALARSTVGGYLGDYIAERKPAKIDAWVDATTYAAVVDAAGKTGADRLKPIFEFLGGKVGYDEIRWVLSHHRAMYEGGREKM